MRLSGTTRFFAASLAVFFTVVGCGRDELTDVPDTENSPDSSRSEEILLKTVGWPDTPRRGPVLLSVELVDANNDVTGVRVERETDSSWQPITALWNERQGSRLRWAWDSFADVEADQTVGVRFVASRADRSEVTLERSIHIKNDPETDRLVLVSHGSADDGNGGYTAGSELSAIVWNGTSAGTSQPIRRVMVGVRPQVIRAAPHGRASAVDITQTGEWAIDIVRTPLDASLSAVEAIQTLHLPEGTPTDFHWSPDGRYLWVAGNAPNVLWRFEPSEDLTAWPAPQRIVELPGPSLKFAVDPVQARLFVHCGPGGVPGAVDKLIVYDATGVELGRHEAELGGTNGLAVSADGTLGMWAGLFSDDVQLFSLENGVSPIGAPVEVGSPHEVHFHPDRNSRAVLVSRFERNAVTPLLASATTLTPGVPLTGLPLAAEMDRFERGGWKGVFLVPVVSSPATIKAVRLNTDGSAEKLDVSIVLGSGFGATSYGVAIQR